MRAFGRFLGRVLLSLFVLAGVLWLVGPYEPVDREIAFDPAEIGADVDAYLAAREAAFDNITPGVEKRVVWAGETGAKTPVSVIYMHGFSASSEEIRPVPDKVAEALGANLYFTRLKGHGRGGAAMAEPSAGDWIEDMAEAMAIGRLLGERVLVIATSTGGTLAALAAVDPAMSADLAGVVLISPNFEIANSSAPLLTFPAARYWVPLIAGEERSFTPRSEGQATYWTTRYPTVSILPMAALVKHVRGLDFSTTNVPALFIISDADRVVKASAAREVAGAWGAAVELLAKTPREGDDDYAHVLAGDIMSPGMTGEVVSDILGWAAGLDQN